MLMYEVSLDHIETILIRKSMDWFVYDQGTLHSLALYTEEYACVTGPNDP